MTPIDGDGDSMARGGSIVGRSRVAEFVRQIANHSGASVSSSRAAAQIHRLVREFDSLPAGERARCALIAAAAALGGHILMAALLPPSGRPTVAVTTLALLGAGLVALRASIVPRR